MQRLSCGRILCGLVMGVVVAGLPQISKAADFERVKFDTVDGVEIHGTFYPSSKGNKAPCALMLHGLGGSTEQEGWTDLAKKLQDKGFAVLTFDFRGHGDSTNVNTDPVRGFWTYPNNRSLKSFRGGKLKEQISYKDFTTMYNWATLVDDIVAAKHFLDKKNDTGECNSANVAVIGVESGATLGTMWIWDAYKRKRVAPGAFIGTAKAQTEGQDIACAVWLSISPSIGVTTKYSVPVDQWLRTPVREKVPMYFLYGEQDTRVANYTKRLCNSVLHPDSKMKLTGMLAVKDTKLQGRELLGKPSLNTEDLVIRYVSKVMDDKGGNPYVRRDADRMPQWRVPVEAYLR